MSKHALLLKAYLYPYVKRARKDWRLTQEGMAERLRVSPRSYSDLEHGRSSFSAVSLVIFLAHFSDEKNSYNCPRILPRTAPVGTGGCLT